MSELLDRLRAAADRVFEGRGILVAYAHGSRISGRPRPDSDLDVGYYVRRGRPPLRLQEEMALEADLTDAVGVSVDLRHLGDAPLELRGRILEQGVRVHCSDEAERVALEVYVLGRYLDYKETFREMHEARLRNLAGKGR